MLLLFICLLDLFQFERCECTIPLIQSTDGTASVSQFNIIRLVVFVIPSEN